MDKKILVADDEADLRMYIKNTLVQNGLTNILEAADGQIACQVYDAEAPGLVILDINMPNMSGIDALKEIKRKNPAAKIIMCCTMTQISLASEAVMLGALDFIIKPFRSDKILQAVTRLLNDD